MCVSVPRSTVNSHKCFVYVYNLAAVVVAVVAAVAAVAAPAAAVCSCCCCVAVRDFSNVVDVVVAACYQIVAVVVAAVRAKISELVMEHVQFTLR